MRIEYPYLNDKNFLKELTTQHLKDQYVKITVLNWQENPIERIQGKVISLNFTIDGKSSVRRTGSLNFLIEDTRDAMNLLSLNKKITVEIGYSNSTLKYIDYDIIWFPLGLYVINGVTISNSSTGLIASLQLKDKMCLLNGDCGGILPAAVVLDNYETIDQNGERIINRPPIYQIIQELVNHFGGQELGKIIISDLDTRVKQVMRWIGSGELYFLRKDPTGTQTQPQYFMTIDATEYETKKTQGYYQIDGSPFQYGSDIGYIYTDFSYPGDLIMDAGSSITQALDKIIEVLGNYEYFYDIDGNFVFQQIKNFLNNAESKYILDSLNNNQLVPDYIAATRTSEEAYLLDSSRGKSIFSFDDSNLISAYNNTPQYSMIKNDFTVWGIKKDANDNEIPIRYHLVIDKKPEIGNTYQAFVYTDPEDGIDKWHMPIKFTSKNKFPNQGAAGVYYMDTTSNKIYKWGVNENTETYEYIELNVEIKNITTNDWRTQLYFQGVAAEPYGTENNYYYAELLNEWPKIFDIQPDKIINSQKITAYVVKTSELQNNTINKYFYTLDTQKLYKCLIKGAFNSKNYVQIDLTGAVFSTFTPSLHSNISITIAKTIENNSHLKEEYIKNPSSLTYYLDFIDSSTKISQFSVNNIGRRGKVLNEGENINCVFESWIPDFILIPTTITADTQGLREQCQSRGQAYFQVSDEIYNNLAIGGYFNSGYEIIRQLIHQYTSYNENIQLQTLPMFFLQPNTRITVQDYDSNIHGDYMINSLSFNIDTSSQLTINASKALQKI